MPPENNALRRLFCRYYAVLGNLFEAAGKSGISRGEALQISRTRIFKREAAENMGAAAPELVLTGLERLAFGSANDALRLVFSPDMDAEALEKLDVFNISEIKRDKSGGVEIRLFDRQKALERLWEYSAGRTEREAAAKLLDALRGGDTSEAD